jgi:hypothetical protein
VKLQSNKDLYDEVDRIATALVNAGETQRATDLRECLSISTVPGEILGTLRVNLQQLRREKAPTSLQLREPIDNALRYLDRVLGPSRA